MQEALVAQGFTVLSFDRMGVGLSDPNPASMSEFPHSADLVHEMDYVMEELCPGRKWILLGPSMGSIVAQAYIATHPDKVVGFLNMDGLPYPFLRHRSSFLSAGWIYRIYGSLVWTGVLRPFIGPALRSQASIFTCKRFPLTVAIAQMNQTNFYRNVAREMATMMDCCEAAEIAWGRQSVLRLPEQHLRALVGAKPDVSIVFSEDDGRREAVEERSASEPGSSWTSSEQVEAAMKYLMSSDKSSAATKASTRETANAGASHLEDQTVKPLLESDLLQSVTAFAQHSILGDVWKRLAVRVMSARSHDFGNAMANSFYNQDMRDLAAAEHAVHRLLAADGFRTAYPRITHTVMFSKTDDIVRNIQEIANVLNGKQQ